MAKNIKVFEREHCHLFEISYCTHRSWQIIFWRFFMSRKTFSSCRLGVLCEELRGLWLALGMFFVATCVAADTAVLAAAEKIQYQTFSAWVKEAGGCEKIRSYQSPYATRGTVESVLTCQALRLGGYPGAYKLVMVPNYTRAIMLANSGEVAMPAETLWLEDIDTKAYYSTVPLIADGEFEKAVYVQSSNLKNLTIRNLTDLQKYKAVTSRLWLKDWAVLGNMGITTLDASTKEAIVNMVATDRAQFTLMEFRSGSETELRLGSTTLTQVPGVKVILHGERRLSVSKNAPHALEIFNALNLGLSQLRKNGTLARAWRESGFISRQAEGWQALN
jgi:hypothetical protein